MSGRVWKYGDDVSTDLLAPGLYMRSSLDEMAAHCLEALDPAFASGVAAGDIVVGGSSFGAGSSREQAAEVLVHLGVRAVVAKSFGGIFYRNAFNFGLLAVVSPDADRIAHGAEIEIAPNQGKIENRTTGETLVCDVVPDHLLRIVADGGLVPHLEKTFAGGAGQD